MKGLRIDIEDLGKIDNNTFQLIHAVINMGWEKYKFIDHETKDVDFNDSKIIFTKNDNKEALEVFLFNGKIKSMYNYSERYKPNPYIL